MQVNVSDFHFHDLGSVRGVYNCGAPYNIRLIPQNCVQLKPFMLNRVCTFGVIGGFQTGKTHATRALYFTQGYINLGMYNGGPLP